MALVTISSVTTAITNPNVNIRGGKTAIKVAFFIKLKLSGPLTQLKNVHTLQHNFSIFYFFLPIVNNKKKDPSLILMKKVSSVPSADSCLFIFPAKNKQINHIHSTQFRSIFFPWSSKPHLQWLSVPPVSESSLACAHETGRNHSILPLFFKYCLSDH